MMKFFIFLFPIFFITEQTISTQNNKYFSVNIKNLTATKINAGLRGDLIRGKKIFSSRKVNCLSCHKAPLDEKFQGNLGPSLVGVGSIYEKNELRLRVINAKIINPNSIMPSYFVKINNPRTPEIFFNKTILSAQEVEDIVEYLYSLK